MDQKKLRTASTRLQPLLALALLILLGVGCSCYKGRPPAPVSDLHLAAQNNKPEDVVRLVSAGADIHAFGGHSWGTPLHWAAEYNSVEAGRALLASGADPNFRDPDGCVPLHTAAAQGSLKMIELLLEHGAGVDLADRGDETPLFAAASQGVVGSVVLLLEAGADPELPANWGVVPLRIAARRGHKDVVAALLKAGANPDGVPDEEKRKHYSNRDSCGAIGEAAMYGYAEIVRMLLNAGAVATLRNSRGRTPIFGARGAEVLEMLVAAGGKVNDLDEESNTPLHLAPTSVEVEFLLSHGADIAAPNKRDQTPLITAISDERQDAAAALIKKGSLSIRDQFGWNALHWAAREGDNETVNSLLKAGANVNTQSYFGETAYEVARNLKGSTKRNLKPERSEADDAARQADEAMRQLTGLQLGVLLLQAVGSDRPDMVSRLLDAGADLGSRDFRGFTALHIAVDKCRSGIVKTLVRGGADANTREENGRTPLHYVRTLEDLRVLLAAGANVTVCDLWGNTPLHTGADYWFVTQATEMTKTLIAAGADVNARNKDGDTPLHEVVGSRHWGAVPERARTLIAGGAEVNARNKEGDTPLHVAVSSEDAKLVQELLDAGADVHAKAKDGRKPMHIGSIYGPARDVGGGDVFALLMAAGADINETDPQGRTALHWAASSGRERMCELLIPRMKDVNAADAEGDTALHFAALGRTINCLRCIHPLIRGGANVNARNAMGRTPLHIAALKGDRDRSSALLEHKADKSAKDNEGHTPYDLGEKLHSGFRERLEPGGK